MARIDYYGTGRRKTSVARVWITNGNGHVLINGREVEEYFPREIWVNHALQPFYATQTKDKFDAKIFVKGGGLTGQSGAVRHGIARALLEANESFKASLRSEGLLTRDSRMVESKKYGKKKARRGQQFSKR